MEKIKKYYSYKRSSRTIPFGYKVDKTGKVLIPIESQLDALNYIKKKLTTNSYRTCAKILYEKTGRYISYVGLIRRIISDDKDFYINRQINYIASKKNQNKNRNLKENKKLKSIISHLRERNNMFLKRNNTHILQIKAKHEKSKNNFLRLNKWYNSRILQIQKTCKVYINKNKKKIEQIDKQISRNKRQYFMLNKKLNLEIRNYKNHFYLRAKLKHVSTKKHYRKNILKYRKAYTENYRSKKPLW